MKVESLNQIKIINNKSNLINGQFDKKILKNDYLKCERPISITIFAKYNSPQTQNRIYMKYQN